MNDNLIPLFDEVLDKYNSYDGKSCPKCGSHEIRLEDIGYHYDVAKCALCGEILSQDINKLYR